MDAQSDRFQPKSGSTDNARRTGIPDDRSSGGFNFQHLQSSDSLEPSLEIQLLSALDNPHSSDPEIFELFRSLYTLDSPSDVSDSFLDELNSKYQQRIVDGYLLTVFGSCHFPDLHQVRETIERHATEALHHAIEQAGVTLLFSGYDSASSLGRNIPLPGSDIDHWVVVIDGTREQCKQVKEQLHCNIDPLITNLNQSSHNPPLVISRSALFESVNTPGTQDSFYLMRLPLSEWSASHKKWSSPAEDLRAKPFVASNPAELKALAMQFRDDRERNDWVHSSCAVEILREGVVLEQEFDPQDLQRLTQSPLFQTSNQLKQIRNIASLQSKHRARECFEDFNLLETTEQFLLVRVFLEQHLRQDSWHDHLLRLTPDNSQVDVTTSLIEKGFLAYRDPKLTVYIPSELPQDYQTLKPFMIPGKYAEAAFHNHLAFERDLPFDY